MLNPKMFLEIVTNDPQHMFCFEILRPYISVSLYIVDHIREFLCLQILPRYDMSDFPTTHNRWRSRVGESYVTDVK